MDSSIEELHKACRVGDIVSLSDLISKNPLYLNNNDNKLGWCLLYRGAVFNQLSTINFLLKKGADPNTKNRLGESPLHAAASNNFLDIARALLDSGANPNFQQNDGDTPLHHACLKGHSEMVELLLKYGADPSQPNKVLSKTAIDYAIEGNHSEIIQLLHHKKNKSCLGYAEESLSVSKESTYEPESEKTSRSRNGSNSQLFSWLGKRRLESVYETLVQNGYDDLNLLVSQMQSNLPLTENDLKKIGVKKPGIRMRLLAGLEQEMNKKPKMGSSKSLSRITWCGSVPASPGTIFNPGLEEFLDGLGLKHLAPKFVEAGIDDYDQIIALMNSKFPITDEFLVNEIGIVKIGYRHRLLSRLNEEAGMIKRNSLKIEKVNVKSACECILF